MHGLVLTSPSGHMHGLVLTSLSGHMPDLVLTSLSGHLHDLVLTSLSGHMHGLVLTQTQTERSDFWTQSLDTDREVPLVETPVLMKVLSLKPRLVLYSFTCFTYCQDVCLCHFYLPRSFRCIFLSPL